MEIDLIRLENKDSVLKTFENRQYSVVFQWNLELITIYFAHYICFITIYSKSCKFWSLFLLKVLITIYLNHYLWNSVLSLYMNITISGIPANHYLWILLFLQRNFALFILRTICAESLYVEITTYEGGSSTITNIFFARFARSYRETYSIITLFFCSLRSHEICNSILSIFDVYSTPVFSLPT